MSKEVEIPEAFKQEAEGEASDRYPDKIASKDTTRAWARSGFQEGARWAYRHLKSLEASKIDEMTKRAIALQSDHQPYPKSLPDQSKEGPAFIMW